jgi:hypothetical protein
MSDSGDISTLEAFAKLIVSPIASEWIGVDKYSAIWLNIVDA